MTDENIFADLVRRIREGDDQACAQFVASFSSVIRAVAHVRMRRDPELRRFLDSADICQSVFKSFFIRARLGEYELSSEEEVQNLLRIMAQHKIINQIHRQRRQRRHPEKPLHGIVHAEQVVDPEPEPSTLAAHQELVQKFLALLSADNAQIAEQLSAGQSWKEIGEARGEAANTVRMRYSREIDRISKVLGLDD